MRIIKERTRLMFVEYNSAEEKLLEDLVGTMDKVFAYKDPDGKMIAFPTGMEDSVKKLFPKIHIEDHSKEYWDYVAITPVEHKAEPRNQLQVDFIKFVLENANKKRNVAGILSPGTGKCEPISNRIPTPNGYTLMGDIKVGDKVFGSNGKQINVTGIFPQGLKDVYEITFNDRRKARCGLEHLWTVYLVNTDEYKTLTLEEIIKDYRSNYASYSVNCVNYRNPSYHYKYRIPVLNGYIDYNKKDTKISPYNFSRNLQVKYDTIIPDEYLYNSKENRLELLRGFLDNNGEVFYESGHYKIKYRSKSAELLKQLNELVRGLGFYGIIETDRRLNDYSHDIFGYINIEIHDDMKENIVSDPEKLAKLNKYTNYNKRFNSKPKHLIIQDVKCIGKEECQCIMVDSEDHLYLTQDDIVTHNTFMACYSSIKVGARTLIIVPTSNIRAQWAETLIEMFNVAEDKVKVVNSPKDFINIKADFVVVSQASLASLNKTFDLEKIMKANKFGIKVIDEVQMWFHNIIKVDANSNIANNWYLTGTFGRSGDEENALYQEMFGDLAIFREKDKEPTLFNRKPGNVYGMKPHMHVKMMWGHSGLSKESIAKVSSTMRYSERSGKWVRYGLSIPAYTELIIPSDGTPTKFLKDILRVIKSAEADVTYGKTLILTSTIASCNVLYDYVSKLFPKKNIGTINSRNTKVENDRVKAECDILISTVSSAGTGFDVKGLAKLIVVQPFKSWILADQVSGRLRRRDDGKDTYMWDIVDASVPQLRAWANARADVLRRKSKSFKVIDL